MSSNTKNLGLLKKDPGTDGAETFNIKTMMNDNWDKIDAAVPGVEVKDAPAGTDHMFLYDNAAAGKPKKVLLSKLVELWKKTFYTKEDTDSLLSKKAAARFLPQGYDIFTLTEPGLYMVICPMNSPYDPTSWCSVELNYSGENGLLRWFDLDRNIEYRTYKRYGEAWRKWEPIATATPPQEYDLPLAAGWSARPGSLCTYYKTQEGIVDITFKANHSGPIPIGTQPLATLPVGFRPRSIVNSVCMDIALSGHAMALWVASDGTIYFSAVKEIPASDLCGVLGSISFLAALST